MGYKSLFSDWVTLIDIEWRNDNQKLWKVYATLEKRKRALLPWTLNTVLLSQSVYGVNVVGPSNLYSDRYTL